MRAKSFTFILFLLFPFLLFSQEYTQYFDGADTSAWNSILINMDTTNSNVWQIGPPQKTIFNSAATTPNVIVTDTINFYPSSDSSNFYFDIHPDAFGWGILALQWKQKLDFDGGLDGGIIEFTNDAGITWQNVFNNPYVYSFYGFDDANMDTLQNGQFAFSGTDQEWKDIWLCFDISWLNSFDTLTFRYALSSDSIDNNREGWMIDNLLEHVTLIHTINEVEQEKYLLVTPNPTSGKVFIQARKIDGFHIIQQMELMDVEGKILKKFGISPTKFNIDLSSYANGIYFLRVKTNLQTETVRIVLQH